jgi:diguanylate cyclase (GGDEF)-like protein
MLSAFHKLVWSSPEPLLSTAGASGELLVGKIRLLLTAVLLAIPIMDVASLSDLRETAVGLGLTISAFTLALGAFFLVYRGFRRSWFGFATSCFDVTIVSCALAVFLVLGLPHTAVNSKVVFEGYFIAIGATALRYDRRVCVVAGFLALAEYLAIVLIAATKWDLNNPIYQPFPYGMFSWNSQVSRLILLLTATVLSIAVVSRAQELLRLSTSDALTGLFNRGYISDRLAAELERAGRYGHSLTVAMVDIDYFKQFNDHYGHAAGDQALKSIAGRLRQCFRRSDIVGRYGGDEFVILMPETDPDIGARRVEAFRAILAMTAVSPARMSPAAVTISAGLAGFPRDAAKEEELLAIADARMFEAKADGRNGVVDQARAERAETPWSQASLR